jgi:hypothetical protein
MTIRQLTFLPPPSLFSWGGGIVFLQRFSFIVARVQDRKKNFTNLYIKKCPLRHEKGEGGEKL